MLLCNRPHVDSVDFTDARLIVSKSCGLDLGERHLEMGDEIPRGVLSVEALRLIYDTPLRLIETLDYAVQDPSLLEACLRRGADNSDGTPEFATGGIVQNPDPAETFHPGKKGTIKKRK